MPAVGLAQGHVATLATLLPSDGTLPHTSDSGTFSYTAVVFAWGRSRSSGGGHNLDPDHGQYDLGLGLGICQLSEYVSPHAAWHDHRQSHHTQWRARRDSNAGPSA